MKCTDVCEFVEDLDAAFPGAFFWFDEIGSDDGSCYLSVDWHGGPSEAEVRAVAQRYDFGSQVILCRVNPDTSGAAPGAI